MSIGSRISNFPQIPELAGNTLRDMGFFALNKSLEGILVEYQKAGSDVILRMKVLAEASSFLDGHHDEISQSESNVILERRIRSLQSSSKAEFDLAEKDAELRFAQAYASFNRGNGIRAEVDEAVVRVAGIKEVRKRSLGDPAASYVGVRDARLMAEGVLSRLDALSVPYEQNETAPLLSELDRLEAVLREASRPSQLYRRVWWAVAGTPRAFDMSDDLDRIAAARTKYGCKPEIVSIPETLNPAPPVPIPLHPSVPPRAAIPDYIDSLVYPEDPHFFRLKRILIGKEGKTDWLERLSGLDREIRDLPSPRSAGDVQNMTELRDALQDFGRGRYLASLIKRHEAYDQAYQKVLDGMSEYVGKYQE